MLYGQKKNGNNIEIAKFKFIEKKTMVRENTSNIQKEKKNLNDSNDRNTKKIMIMS